MYVFSYRIIIVITAVNQPQIALLQSWSLTITLVQVAFGFLHLASDNNLLRNVRIAISYQWEFVNMNDFCWVFCYIHYVLYFFVFIGLPRELLVRQIKRIVKHYSTSSTVCSDFRLIYFVSSSYQHYLERV